MARSAVQVFFAGMLGLAFCVDVPAAPPGGYSPTPAPRSAEVMLYFSHSIGGTGGGAFTGASRPTFGLRVSQVHQGANSGDPDAAEPMQHRELFNWQMQARPDLRIASMKFQFGHRLTYDVTNRTFGGQGARSVVGFAAAAKSPPTGPGTRNSPFSREPFRVNAERDNANFREIAAAAVAALTPARPVQTQHPVRAPAGRLPGRIGPQP